MTIFNQSINRPSGISIVASLIAACTLTSITHVKADTVELTNGDTLTGTIQALSDGLVVLRSPLAYEPLEIKAESISKMSFPRQKVDNPTHTERLTLSNNDVIPCQVVSMDEKQLYISTWYAGNFSIPRTNVKALQFGLSKEKTLFVGNDAPSKWSTREGSWSLTGNTYTSRGTGTLARKLDLPKNVRFNFNFAWKETPNFSFRFCAENDSPTTNQDTYELLFNSAGMQIRRCENVKQPAAPIANIPIKPRSFANQSMNVDLRVNRTEGLLSLYIDTKLVGTWPDPFATSTGNYIIFNNRTSRKTSCIISDVKVTGLNDGILPRHREKASSAQSDVLIDSEGEKISGTLTSISKADANKRTITLEVKHSDQPLRVPDRRISTLSFAQPDDLPDFPQSTFTALIDDDGKLQLENPKIIDGKLISIHPILGPCTLSPKVLTHITQSQARADKADKTSTK